jgi:hypothetical protein
MFSDFHFLLNKEEIIAKATAESANEASYISKKKTVQLFNTYSFLKNGSSDGGAIGDVSLEDQISREMAH